MRISSACVLAAAALLGSAEALHAPTLSVSHRGMAGPRPTLAASTGLRKAPAAALSGAEGAMHLRGGAGSSALVFSLFKAIVGSGVLCLSGGMASFTNDKSFIPAAAAVAAFSCTVSAYCYYNVGRVCAETGAHTYKGAWQRTVGPGTAWIPSMIIIMQTAVATICYAIIIGDVLRDLAQTAKLTGKLAERNTLLPLAGACVLLPLCLLRDFGMLAYTSMFGVAGIIYTALFMGYRYFTGSYAPGGDMINKLRADQKPQFGSTFVPVKTLILVSMFNTAFLAHYDSPKFLGMVKNNLGEFRKLVEGAFSLALVACIFIMSMGFMTFGGGSLGLILNNYANKDGLALYARGGMLASIIFGFPLVFSGFRTGALAFFDITHPSQFLLDAMAVGTVVAAVSIGMVMTDLGFAASFSGALFGTALIFIFPSMMMMFHEKKAIAADALLPKKRGFLQGGPVSKGLTLSKEYYLNVGIMLLGVALAGIGASVSVLKSFTDILD